MQEIKLSKSNMKKLINNLLEKINALDYYIVNRIEETKNLKYKIKKKTFL